MRKTVYLRKLYKENPHCHYCGIHTVKKDQSNGASLDHIVPKSRGGEDIRENLVLSCIRCNMRKSGMTYENMMRYRPWELPVSSFLLLKKQLTAARHIEILYHIHKCCPTCRKVDSDE